MSTLIYDLAASQPNNARFHGGGEYSKTVFRSVLAHLKGETVIGVYSPHRWMDPKLVSLAEQYGVEMEPIGEPSDLQGILDRTNRPRFYSAMPSPYQDLDFSGVHLIFTIHGLRALEIPTDRFEFIYGGYLWPGIKQLTKSIFGKRYKKSKENQLLKIVKPECRTLSIIVPSLHTKYSMMSHFGSDVANKVHVIPSPIKPIEREADQPGLFKKLGLKDREYLLLVSGGRWVKNAYRAIKAIDQIINNQRECRPVLVIGVDEPRWLRKTIRNKGYFHFHGYLDEEELQYAYANAYALIYPTLNEGYGYPPLECMGFGTPVLAAAVSATTEVLKDAAIYFNPYSINEMKIRILMILSDKEIYQDYSERGFKRYSAILDEQHTSLEQLTDIILGRDSDEKGFVARTVTTSMEEDEIRDVVPNADQEV